MQNYLEINYMEVWRRKEAEAGHHIYHLFEI
jgi:hypothetical protein